MPKTELMDRYTEFWEQAYQAELATPESKRVKKSRWKQFFTWQRSSVIWFLIDFAIGGAAVLLAFLGKALPISSGLLASPAWHPGALPAAILYGGILGLAYYSFGGGARTWRRHSWPRNLLVSFSCVTLSSIVMVLVFYIFLLQLGRGVVVLITLQSFLATYLLRLVIFSHAAIEARTLLFITDSEHKPSPQMARLLEDRYRIITIDRSHLSRATNEALLDEWKSISVEDVVFVARCDRKQTESLMEACWTSGIRFVEWNFFVESNFQKLNVYDQHLDWLMHFDQQYAHPSYSKVKRGLDILTATAGIIIGLPLLLLGGLAVLISSGRPVFFKQERVGARGGTFTLWKLRTMANHDSSKDPIFSQGDSDNRITKVGSFLRKTRIDELPQFFNVFAGDMSLVGPRPEWTEVANHWQEKLPMYTYRTMVKPGLTGWAQVNFPYAATREEVLEKLSYDFYYIKHASIQLDLRIILRTFAAMIEGGK